MSFLVINFGDNDFYNALSGLAEHVIQDVGEEAIKAMDKDGSLDDRLTEMFRCMCVLHQTRWDMYANYGTPAEEAKRAALYLSGDYYQIKDAKIVESHDYEWNNSETLIVDLTNSQWNVV
ncbi:hypothetical protein HYP06_gp036 [Vibrio phage vB_VspP_pVa5]|uniref:Uncharacterized protein n=1 Tax=Vibrio phage vB_VspP_pVa5 TaxID=1913109 RepID=A0A1J0GV64_9CAUD|nr:hypothetical protein HYP06_gp036 [Vibrio phage vB_VspP_pVa5]APC46068.1 hypothetical protein vBVspPpVa5_0036 [Vibrio phage vB_VspP_pVa5]